MTDQALWPHTVVISHDQKLNEIGERVLAAVAEAAAPIKSSEVVQSLRTEGLAEDLLRIAILYLIDYDVLDLSSDRLLTIPPHPSTNGHHD